MSPDPAPDERILMSADTEKQLLTIHLTDGGSTEEQNREPRGSFCSESAPSEQASLDLNDGSGVDPRAGKIIHNRKGTVKAAFEALSKAAGGAFDASEDVDLFANRIREGEAP